MWWKYSSILAYYRKIIFDREGCPKFWKGGPEIYVEMEKGENFMVLRPLFPSNNFGEGGIDHFCISLLYASF